MSNFKTGDRVRVTNHPTLPSGATGTVSGPGNFADTMMIDWDNPDLDLEPGGWFRNSFELIPSTFDGIKVGDTVRVVSEGVVTHASTRNIEVGDQDLYAFDESDGNIVSVEKVAPPVEQFQPGDIVRQKDSTLDYALGDTGYVELYSGRCNQYDSVVGLDFFTSKIYEKIEVGA